MIYLIVCIYQKGLFIEAGAADCEFSETLPLEYKYGWTGSAVILSNARLSVFPGTMRRYIVEVNHIGLAVTKFLWYRQTFCYFYIRKYKILADTPLEASMGTCGAGRRSTNPPGTHILI